jgi:hypothetical protein
MGHSLIGAPPASRHWRNVVELIGGGADVADVALAVSKAAEGSLRAANQDVAIGRSLWLLAQIPLAARRVDFSDRLGELGLGVVPKPTLIDICTSFVTAVDRHVHERGRRSDSGEMAILSGVESLMAATTPASEDLFPDARESKRAQQALARLATARQFGQLAREFVGRLTRRYLEYYLSRELPQHVGIACRFRTMKELKAFDAALDLHCREAAAIMETFAGEWFSKTNYESEIDTKNILRLARGAFEKMQSELRLRRETDG